MKPDLFSLLWTVMLMLALSSNSYQASAQKHNNITTLIQARFDRLAQLNYEKLYLHLDKPYYAAGEEIWFKGYLWTQQPTAIEEASHFIYIELANQYDSIVIRRKYARDSTLQFTGHLALPALLPEGQYSLRAYTRWMQNTSPQQYYVRNLLIGSPMPNRIRAEVSYVPLLDGKIEACVQLLEKDTPMVGKWLFCNINSNQAGKKTFSRKLKTDAQGVVKFPIALNGKQLKNSKPAIEVLLDSDTYSFSQSFPIPQLQPDFALTFFPEGGPLLAEIEQKIAFKAQNEYGFGQAVSGYILTAKGDTLANFASRHAGMGEFLLRAPAGVALRAVARTESGLEKEFNLPSAESDRLTLQLSESAEEIGYRVLAAQQAIWPDSLFVIAHAGEQLCYLHSLTQANSQGVISTKVLPQGLIRVVLCNSEGIPLSERLLFAHPSPNIRGEISKSASTPGARQPVDIELTLSDLEKLAVAAELSVSITDRDVVAPLPYTNNIFTNLLLTSDLVQGIEEPGYYFFSSDPDRLANLRLLLMTHGWSRFYTDSLLSTTPPPIKYPRESMQELNGRVTTLLNRSAKNCPVWLLVPKDSLMATSVTDSLGRFSFCGLNHQDTTDIYVSYMGKGNKKLFEVTCDQDPIPPYMHKLPFGYLPRVTLPENYLKNVREELIDSLDLIAHQLKEVVVEGRASFDWCDLRDNEYIVEGETKHFSARSLARPANLTALDAILSLPGMTMRSSAGSFLSGKKIFYGEGVVVIYVNDILLDIDVNLALELIPFSDIQELSLYKVISPYDPGDELYFFCKMHSPNGREKAPFGNNFEYFSNGYYDMLRIKLKRDTYKYTKRATPWMQRVVSLGYTAQKKRYEPVYDTPEQREDPTPDRRTTLYWNPSLVTSAQGKASIRFYTADAPANYHIVIEGATTDGNLIFIELDL